MFIFTAADLQQVLSAGNVFPDRLVVDEVIASLIHVGSPRFHLPRGHFPVGVSWPVIKRNSVVLPAPLAPIIQRYHRAAAEVEVAEQSRSS